MRISGFSSGLDIDALVQELMKSHKSPLTKLQKQSIKVDWQQEAYRNVSTSLVDLRNNKLSSYSLSSSISAKKAEVAGNTTAISATATGASSQGVYTVKVLDLAKAAQSSATSSITGSAADDKFTSDGTIQINGVDISYTTDDTLNTLMTKINNSKEANVTAIYNSTNGKISLTSKSTGGTAISTDDAFKTLVGANDWTNASGSKARAEINGVEVESDTNQVSINGLSIQLKTIHSGDSVSTVTVNSDTDKILSTIKSFINDYNSVIANINSKLGEDKYRTYDPLTDEEKSEMTDKQIEIWETKAKSGLLRNDTILSALVSDMRTATMAEVGVGANAISLNSLGITTGSWYEGGKLVIDNEQALIAAIENDPDQVLKLFNDTTSSAATSTNKTTDTGLGIFQKLSSILMDSLVTLSDKAGTSRTSTSTTGAFLESSLLGQQKKSIATKMSDYQAKLTALETQYYKRFTAMETAINRYNSQASSISSYSG